MTPPPAPIEAVSQRLASFLQARVDEWGSSGAEARAFVENAASTLSGGKRLRARFCVTGWRAVAEHGSTPAAPPEAVLAAAGALEIFHAAALVHDDIIDNSDTRRGRPAAHRALEAHHGASRWAGAGGAFGRSAAILLGDLLVAWSDDLLEDGLRAVPHAAAARTVYALMRPQIAVMVLSASRLPSFNGLPVRMALIRSVCSCTYGLGDLRI